MRCCGDKPSLKQTAHYFLLFRINYFNEGSVLQIFIRSRGCDGLHDIYVNLIQLKSSFKLLPGKNKFTAKNKNHSPDFLLLI